MTPSGRVAVEIEALRLPLVDHDGYAATGAKFRPYPHQAALFDRRAEPALLLSTGTGSGKTIAAALPLIADGLGAIFVYPTNALAEDQARAIKNLFKDLGREVRILEAGAEWDLAARDAVATLVHIDASSLDDFRRRFHARAKGTVLRQLLSHREKPLFVLTNPDTLFFLLLLRYRQGMEALAHLWGLALVLDELHLYHGVELAKLLFTVQVARKILRAPRLVMLTATPDPEVQALVERLFGAVPLAAGDLACMQIAGERTVAVAHPITLELVAAIDPVAWACEWIMTHRPELEGLRGEGEVPLVVILNSVVSAIALEDRLRQAGLPGDAIGIYRGLSHHGVRAIEGKLLVLGTSAIEVGVDFDAHRLIFEAGTAASFVQRLGRIARHRPGQAFLFATERVRSAFAEMASPVSRGNLYERVKRLYGDLDARPWFVSSRLGIFVAAAAFDRLRETLIAAGGEATATEILSEYSTRIGASASHVKSALYRLKQRHEWVAAYLKGLSFRGGASVEVFDVRECERRGDPRLAVYEADLLTLLERATITRIDDGDSGPRAVVTGYGKRKSIRAYVETGIADGLGVFAEANEANLGLSADGGAAPQALVDTLRDGGHIVAEVAREIESELDWRIRTFETDRDSLVALDDAALLCRAIEERRGVPSQ